MTVSGCKWRLLLTQDVKWLQIIVIWEASTQESVSQSSVCLIDSMIFRRLAINDDPTRWTYSLNLKRTWYLRRLFQEYPVLEILWWICHRVPRWFLFNYCTLIVDLEGRNPYGLLLGRVASLGVINNLLIGNRFKEIQDGTKEGWWGDIVTGMSTHLQGCAENVSDTTIKRTLNTSSPHEKATENWNTEINLNFACENKNKYSLI